MTLIHLTQAKHHSSQDQSNVAGPMQTCTRCTAMQHAQTMEQEEISTEETHQTAQSAINAQYLHSTPS